MNVLHILPQPAATAWEPHYDECEVEQVVGYPAATQCLQQRSYDAILVDVEDETDLASGVCQIRQRAGRAPIIAISDQMICLDPLALGLDAFLEKTELKYISFDQALHKALQQRAAQISSLDTQLRQNHQSLIQPVGARSAAHPVSLYPVFGHANVSITHAVHGSGSVERTGDLHIELSDVSKFAADRAMVSMQTRDGRFVHAIANIREASPCQSGYVLTARIATDEADLLSETNLTPNWNPHTHRFATALPPNTVDSLVQTGVLTPYLYDRTMVCPDCHATPTLRFGCRACGSVETEKRRMIHHFACAHVGPVETFETNNELVCPKCRVRSLVIGADFEYLEGSHECGSCGHTDLELEMVGQCHMCNLRFSMEFALEEEVMAYHVERLDPLAIIAAS